MPSVIPVKGTHDIVADEAKKFDFVESVFSILCELNGYQHIITPAIEYTSVFARDQEDASDMVRKEMYTFLDKGDRSLTLRPEGTAGIMRSILSNKLYATPDLPLRYFYSGPNYRYERPQLGRYREFRQFGVECFGLDSYRLDAEVIALCYRFFQSVGFENLVLKVNTLGDKASRDNYRTALKAYFEPQIEQMCEDCKERLRLNPLRILDCKVPEDQARVAGAPKIPDYLTASSRERFKKTLEMLDLFDIPYEEDPTLVRGLDYYGEIVFEVHGRSPEGKDYGALAGGGHYEGIIDKFGGPKECDVGVGFALGVERLVALGDELHLFDGVGYDLDFYAMPLEESALDFCYTVADYIRKVGFSVEVPPQPGKVGALFKRANRKKARFAIIVGEAEIASQSMQIKNLESGEQVAVKLADLDDFLDSIEQKEE